MNIYKEKYNYGVTILSQLDQTGGGGGGGGGGGSGAGGGQEGFPEPVFMVGC